MNRPNRMAEPDKVRAQYAGALWVARAYENEVFTWAEAMRQMKKLGIAKPDAERFLACSNEG